MADPQPAFRYACICERLRAAEQRGYGNAMDDGWGEPEHIKAAVAAARAEMQAQWDRINLAAIRAGKMDAFYWVQQGQRDERKKWVDLARGDSKAYDLGQSDERARIRAAVEARTAGRERMEWDEEFIDQVAAHNAYIDCVRDVLAVIDGNSEGPPPTR
jgi:hypothetical protein